MRTECQPGCGKGGYTGWIQRRAAQHGLSILEGNGSGRGTSLRSHRGHEAHAFPENGGGGSQKRGDGLMRIRSWRPRTFPRVTAAVGLIRWISIEAILRGVQEHGSHGAGPAQRTGPLEYSSRQSQRAYWQAAGQ